MLLRAATGQIERLDAGGFPVGLLPKAEYEQGETLLQPGDAVLCCSDGISEATNEADEMWAETDVEKVIRNCRGLTAQQMIDRLVETADRFTGAAEQADDMTIVVIRITEEVNAGRPAVNPGAEPDRTVEVPAPADARLPWWAWERNVPEVSMQVSRLASKAPR